MKENKGFSLVELIVVIVILAVLIGVTIGGIYQYVNKARVNTDINNARTINDALASFATDEEVYKKLEDGDSGGVLWNRDNVSAVGLNTSKTNSDKEKCLFFYNKIRNLLSLNSVNEITEEHLENNDLPKPQTDNWFFIDFYKKDGTVKIRCKVCCFYDAQKGLFKDLETGEIFTSIDNQENEQQK